MATENQLSFLISNKNLIREPVLIVGSKQYDFDKRNIRTSLEKSGLKDVTGIDISAGDGVDHVADITDLGLEYVKRYKEFYATIICMEVLTHVKNPFKASENLISLLQRGGVILLSECYVRKISKMPIDLWRFTYDGTKELFSSLEFDDSKAMISLTREKNEKLLPLNYPLPQILAEKHEDETRFGYLIRRIHRKYFAKGIFKISRLMPETTIYSIAKK